MAPPKKSKRYQNIATLMTSVIRHTQGGPRPYALRPGQVVMLSEAEIEESKDTHRIRENNPFDMGWVVLVPEGKTSHPDAPDLGKNPSKADAELMSEEADPLDYTKTASRIRDKNGILTLRRALDASLEGRRIRTERHRELTKIIDSQETEVDRIVTARIERFKAKV